MKIEGTDGFSQPFTLRVNGNYLTAGPGSHHDAVNASSTADHATSWTANDGSGQLPSGHHFCPSYCRPLPTGVNSLEVTSGTDPVLVSHLPTDLAFKVSRK